MQEQLARIESLLINSANQNLFLLCLYCKGSKKLPGFNIILC